MTYEFGTAFDMPVDMDAFDLELDLNQVAPAASLLRIVGTASIGAGGHDQYLVLHINNDAAAGQYWGTSIDFAPGYHADHVRSINNGLIVGYTGWGLDADVVFDLVLSVVPGINRNASGNYTTTHSGGRQYISQIGGAYLNRTAAITGCKMALPQGGIFRGGKLSVSVAG